MTGCNLRRATLSRCLPSIFGAPKDSSICANSSFPAEIVGFGKEEGEFFEVRLMQFKSSDFGHLLEKRRREAFSLLLSNIYLLFASLRRRSVCEIRGVLNSTQRNPGCRRISRQQRRPFELIDGWVEGYLGSAAR